MIDRKTEKQPRKRIDWEAVELAYRLGVDSVRSIATKHGCTEGAIRLKAGNENWTRDLSAKVKAKADDLLRKSELRTELRTNPAAKTTEREQIEISAQVQTNVILAHRKDIPVARALATTMIGELSAQADEVELPKRADTLKKLADSLKVLVGLEREAFGLNMPDTAPTDSLGKLLARIAGGNESGINPIARDPDHDD